ncbi:carboxyltransferase domain-containing protein [Rhodobacterales bacterium HKCCE2091]|nr:carboxyltransferase domain-containing protein [Rhodobacterales bacterium HKCCE2091]
MAEASFPLVRLMGATGVLVRFADRLSEPANRAALAYRAAAEAEGWTGVAETSTALASAFLRVDPVTADPRDVAETARALAGARDWTAEPLPKGRRVWRIPAAWGGDAGPDLAEAAEAAGLSPAEAAAELSRSRTRVLALGFAPGQPYLGELPDRWNLPRRTDLTPEVPAGAILLAVRQFVLFTAPAPTGWRHVGLTAFRTFRPEAEAPIPLRPGDEIEFPDTDADRIRALIEAGDPDGGATAEAIG